MRSSSPIVGRRFKGSLERKIGLQWSVIPPKINNISMPPSTEVFEKTYSHLTLENLPPVASHKFFFKSKIWRNNGIASPNIKNNSQKYASINDDQSTKLPLVKYCYAQQPDIYTSPQLTSTKQSFESLRNQSVKIIRFDVSEFPVQETKTFCQERHQLRYSPRHSPIYLGRMEGIIPPPPVSRLKENEISESVFLLKSQIRHKKRKAFIESHQKYSIKLEKSNSQVQNVSFKIFIGCGNNSQLVKSCFAQRWWCEVADYSFNDTQLQTIVNSENTSDQENGNIIVLQGDQQRQLESLKKFTNVLIWTQSCISGVIDEIPSFSDKKLLNASSRIHNHFSCNFELANKKNLFQNLKEYYERMNQSEMLFQRIPLTFHVKSINEKQKKKEQQSNSFQAFSKAFRRIENSTSNTNKQKNQSKQRQKSPGDALKYVGSKNIWIVKPGENSNRGTGIFVSRDIYEIKQHILQQTEMFQQKGISLDQSREHTFIIQKYIENPLLYEKRKIDIRCFILLTNFQGILKAYWYRDGYVRTSSKEFTTKCLKDTFVHLTNDAIQKHQRDYGRFEQGNKLTFRDIEMHLADRHAIKIDFNAVVIPQMKEYALDCVKSVVDKIDPERKQFCFELFGLDFMLDDNLKLWLIEVNANPCLETSSPLLNRIIPALIHNTLKIVSDSMIQQAVPDNWEEYQSLHFDKNYINAIDKFDCIFSQQVVQNQTHFKSNRN